MNLDSGPECTRPIFVLTVDTEEEWDWSGPFPKAPYSTENIKRIPKFQTFCANHDVSPTYFVDHAVVEKRENRDILSEYFKAGHCDIGAHLHPWCNPPINEEISNKNSHAINLDMSLFREKMKRLTDALVEAFGQHPLSFRSGRWGINGSMLKILAELGYSIDSSVRPFYSDTDFSYHAAKTRPYSPSFENALLADDSQQDLLEVPASSGYNHANFEALDRVHQLLASPTLSRFKLVGLLWRLGLLRKITVTPEGQSAKDICRCIDMSIKRGDPIINMYFHSSDLLPGATSYVQNLADEKRFYTTLETCFGHVTRVHGAEILTMRQLASRFAIN